MRPSHNRENAMQRRRTEARGAGNGKEEERADATRTDKWKDGRRKKEGRKEGRKEGGEQAEAKVVRALALALWPPPLRFPSSPSCTSASPPACPLVHLFLSLSLFLPLPSFLAPARSPARPRVLPELHAVAPPPLPFPSPPVRLMSCDSQARKEERE